MVRQWFAKPLYGSPILPHASMTNKLSYIGTKAIICDGDKILITQEPLTFIGGGKWELPGGKLSEGEEHTPLEESLRREIEEELGKNIRVKIENVVDIVRRPWNKPGAQANLVFLATFRCTYISGDITLSDENHAFAWVTKDELKNYEFISGYLPVLENFFEKTK